jgi:hypothetical protein
MDPDGFRGESGSGSDDQCGVALGDLGLAAEELVRGRAGQAVTARRDKAMRDWGKLGLLLAVMLDAPCYAQTTDDLVFIHHSCGSNWLSAGLHDALLAKDYIDERNDITYGTTMSPDPGDPFSGSQTLTNYKAVYRHPDGPGHTYTHDGYTYRPLEDVFAENPDVLFIPVTAPPRHYAPADAANDAEAHRARLFNNWLKNEWLASYKMRNPGLNNVTVFDWFDVLAYPDDHAEHPNRLKAEYGGERGNSHPNTTANVESTAIFATDPDNFIDAVWTLYSEGCDPIPGDFDGDCDVDLSDLGRLLGAYGACAGDPHYDPVVDIDNSGCVGLSDLGVLLANYGTGT